MKIALEKSVLLVIDMQKAFVEDGMPLRIAGAKATIPDINRITEEARDMGVPVIWVTRNYAPDGSDMEFARREKLKSLGALDLLAPGADGAKDAEGLIVKDEDMRMIKPRYSCFFNTDLDKKLRDMGVENVLIAGTTTPNCIRATCYDAISYDYVPVVLERCCSSNTREIQAANMLDMKNAGAIIFEGDSLKSIIDA